MSNSNSNTIDQKIKDINNQLNTCVQQGQTHLIKIKTRVMALKQPYEDILDSIDTVNNQVGQLTDLFIAKISLLEEKINVQNKQFSELKERCDRFQEVLDSQKDPNISVDITKP